MRVRFLIHVLDQNCLTEVDNIPPVQVVIPVFLKGSQRQKKKKKKTEQTEREDHALCTEMYLTLFWLSKSWYLV